jgi:hypothetical protein
MANITDITPQISNLLIHEITIIGKSGEIYKIWPNLNVFSFVSLSITEGMFEASVSGQLTIRDLSSTAEQINFSGFEDLIIRVENPDISKSYKSLRFKIYNVQAESDQADSNKYDPDTHITKNALIVQFLSYEHYLLNHRDFSELAGSTGSDIITTIASSSNDVFKRALDKFAREAIKMSRNALIAAGYASGLNAASRGAVGTIIAALNKKLNSKPKPIGLVNLIESKFFKTGRSMQGTTQKSMFIEPTKNWIWYKQNQLMYPWSKLNRPIKPLQLMQYLAEYAVAESNPYVCNFLFWQDLDRWNFRSIESLLQEEQKYREYSITVNQILQLGYIIDLRILNESNSLRLFEANALAAKYQLVEPAWNEPYRKYLDYNESHTITEIKYDYFKDYNKWSKVERYPLIPSDVSTVPTVVNVVQDNISGYFSPNYSNKEKSVSWEHHGYTHGNRDSSITWQPMFDQIELSGATCSIIQREIKNKIKDKKVEYAQKKNLKEKWKVYRYSICCDYTVLDEDQEAAILTDEYKVVSAGGFSDLVNYKRSGFTAGLTAGFTLETDEVPTFPNGLTLSYDFGITGPFSKTIGELMYLRETPDIQTKYLYDLEVKRIDIAEDVIRNSITRLETGKSIVESYPLCSEILEPTTGRPLSDYYCDESSGGGTGFVANCFCTNEEKQTFIKSTYTDPITNRKELLASPYFNNMRNIIEIEKTRFATVYEEYTKRKAFFVSKEVGFTANSAPLNLFNVKSITRIPIRGSKYEKLAHKEVLKQLLYGLSGATANLGLSGVTANFKGFSAGVTSYYPYDIFYDNDKSINPKIKHPYYDSGYNFDLGAGANAFFSSFDPAGGPDSGAAGNPTGVFEYFIAFQAKVKRVTNTLQHIAVYDPGIDGNGPGNDGGVDEFGTDGVDIPPSFTCEPRRQITTIEENKNFTQKDILVENLEQNKLIKNILVNEVSGINLTSDRYSSTNVEYIGNNTVVVTLISPPLDPLNCNNREDITTITITCDIAEIYSDNKNSTQLPTGICVVQPFGLERIPDFNPIEYLNSRNFTNIQEPDAGDEAKRPIENVLEELESFVRIEFIQPIGANTLYDFPKGFYDTPGSEYYLPYHVMLTTGPFGAKSADYNISVLGQDPYGFDVAVKRIRKKKQSLKPENKALVNSTDYHTVTAGYLKGINTYDRNATSTSTNDINDQKQVLDSPISYGENARISNTVRNGVIFNNIVSNYGVLGAINTGTSLNNTFYLSQTSIANSDQTLIVKDNVGNVRTYTPNLSERIFNPGTLNEIFYHDLIKRATRINPLALPNSYFEFNNVRPYGAVGQSSFVGGSYEGTWITNPYSSTSSSTGYYGDGSSSSIDATVRNDIYDLLIPGNVFMYVQTVGVQALPIDTEYFKSYASYDPGAERTGSWGAFFEVDLRNRNARIKPEDETTFFGYYYGVSAWKHPAVPTALLSTEIQKAVWKNDISGETEYGIVGPELDEEFSTFDRNFAAQFIVMSRQNGIQSFSSNYPCANPFPPDNSSCPPSNPLCNCPCPELRPDKLLVGITGPEPTNEELIQLEKDIKECDLIEKVLGEDWLGCVWAEPKSNLNCSCPCLGENFLNYLKYSQTYCSFWETPPERPLLRNAQMMQILSNKIMITVNGDLTLRPGNKIRINVPGKRYSGYWLVSAINHNMGMLRHRMTITLIRDSESSNPDIRSKELQLNTSKDDGGVSSLAQIVAQERARSEDNRRFGKFKQ